MPVFRWNGVGQYVNLRTGESFDPGPLGYDWSDANPPWAGNLTTWEAKIPAGSARRTLSSGATFRQRLTNTCNAAPGRTLIEIPAGVYNFEEFVTIGSGSNPTYAFGFWHPKLQGFIFEDVENTIIQMAPDSVSPTQLDYMKTMTQASFSPLQMGMMRIDGTPESPVFLGGGTFRAYDQPLLTAVNSDVTNNVFVPTPAPHLGVVIYSDTECASVISHTRFKGAARALNSQPPFECANLHTGRGYHDWGNIEVDGRRAPEVDPAQPRRSGVFLINSEYEHYFHDSWIHHSALSRYAANDQNNTIAGEYIVERVKAEHITDNLNTDPALNGGASLGGWTNATPFGWESTNGTITVRNTIISQDNPNPTTGTGQIPMHFQMTTVGGRNPQGGRFYAYDNTYLWPAHPHLNGFAGFRISQSTFWWQDGFNNTIFVYQGGVRLQPHVVTGTWPPTLASLTAQGVTPATHYLIRST